MNKRQKLVQQRFLNNEEEVTKALEKTYETALADVNKKIKNLQLDIDGIQGQLDVWEDFGGDEAEKEQLQSMLQSKIYQKRYQESIQGQLDDVLDKMHTESYKTVDAYLNGCYDEAYIGAFYDMHGQGVPVIAPIDQESVVRAVQIDSKISNGLYSRLGEDVAGLKKTITAEVSRGIANGSTYAQVAQQISFKMVGAYEDRPGGALYRALTIARTEGGRIQSQSAMDACYKARDIGADVLKEWDSTLDGDTRPSHRTVDGEIRELDEPFSNGLDYPRDPSGGAAEVVNCRCALLQRARWAIEGGFSKMNNFTKEIETFESPEDYNEFKKAFWSKENQAFMKNHTDLEKKYGTKDFKKLLESMDDKEYAHYMKLYGNNPIYNKAAKATAKTAVQKPSFVPAKDVSEVKTRLSSALAIPEENINLGRMKPELANQYLKGVEDFSNDYPQIKGFYRGINTKVPPRAYGASSFEGVAIPNTTEDLWECHATLLLRNPKNVQDMLDDYAFDVQIRFHYEGASPYSTAVHELTHGLERMVNLKEQGFSLPDANGKLIIKASEWSRATSQGVSNNIIKDARNELYGKQYGKDVYDDTSYLGKYSMTKPTEGLAEAVSYEYTGKSKPYSAKIKELFDARIKKVFEE